MHRNRSCFGVLNLDEQDSPFLLYDGGIELRQQEKYDFNNADRPDFKGYLFQYTLGGEGYFQQDGETTALPPGTGFLVPVPGNSRYFLGELPWELLYLHFDGAAAQPLVRKITVLTGGILRLSPDSSPIHMLLNLQNRLTSGGHLAKYEGGEFLYGFLCALLREMEQPGGSSVSPLVERASGLMQAEYATLSGVDELAQRLHVSTAHLTRQFSAYMGVSPIRYLTKLRLEAAMNDLLNSEDDLETIARRNGFAGGNYFCKVFRKAVGLSPTQYRRLKC